MDGGCEGEVVWLQGKGGVKIVAGVVVGVRESGVERITLSSTLLIKITHGAG